ncbi:MAG: hypothetical protein JO127_08000 [Caulobacteraceae bacterium]|nr:hypothetical protein [Caulobacteraceae bacterium]
MQKAAVVLALLVLAACAQKPQAPAEAGVCYALASAQGGKVRFNVVARNTADMEHCAAALEGVRERFLSLGGTQQEITGAYQGNFLFVEAEGVFTSSSYDGVRYPFLVRTGDGRLVPPGAAG